MITLVTLIIMIYILSYICLSLQTGLIFRSFSFSSQGHPMDVVFSFTRDVIAEHKAHLQCISNLGNWCSNTNVRISKTANMNMKSIKMSYLVYFHLNMVPVDRSLHPSSLCVYPISKQCLKYASTYIYIYIYT